MKEVMMGAAAWRGSLDSSAPTRRSARGWMSPPVRAPLRLVPTGEDVVAFASVRLTRAGRLTVAFVLTLLLALLLPPMTSAGGTKPTTGRLVVVQGGQTLSHIAARELPQLPIGTAVAEIQLANRLSTTHVHAGQELAIPEVR